MFGSVIISYVHILEIWRPKTSAVLREILHREGFASLYKFLETSENKQISSDILAELADIALHNIFEFDEKTFKQKRGTAIGTKFAPPYTTLYMADLEEKLLEIFEKNQ